MRSWTCPLQVPSGRMIWNLSSSVEVSTMHPQRHKFSTSRPLHHFAQWLLQMLGCCCTSKAQSQQPSCGCRHGGCRRHGLPAWSGWAGHGWQRQYGTTGSHRARLWSSRCVSRARSVGGEAFCTVFVRQALHTVLHFHSQAGRLAAMNISSPAPAPAMRNHSLESGLQSCSSTCTC